MYVYFINVSVVERYGSGWKSGGGSGRRCSGERCRWRAEPKHHREHAVAHRAISSRCRFARLDWSQRSRRVDASRRGLEVCLVDWRRLSLLLLYSAWGDRRGTLLTTMPTQFGRRELQQVRMSGAHGHPAAQPMLCAHTCSQHQTALVVLPRRVSYHSRKSQRVNDAGLH